MYITLSAGGEARGDAAVILESAASHLLRLRRPLQQHPKGWRGHAETNTPAPCTLHSEPLEQRPTGRQGESYTLHPSPYTLHPYTLHATLHSYTLNPSPYTLHPCTLHATPLPPRSGLRARAMAVHHHLP